jgi:hypothetical protein
MTSIVIGASAFSGGISAELQGGKFKDGFKAAFIGSSLRYLYNVEPIA